VKGAPYAAEAITESVQVLADGNRIVHKSSGKMYRDVEGRTRMESTFPGTGLWVPAGGELSMTFIADPVAKVHYTLNNKERTATKVALPSGPGTSGSSMTHSADGKMVRIERNVMIQHQGAGGAPPPGAGPAVMVFHGTSGAGAAGAPNVQKESLGKQTIEGVACDGTRETTTIPAGRIGNEREIKTVIERWHSAELGMDVLRKQTDPRAGETTYRVTGIVRADQPKALFEVPGDYKLEDMKLRHAEGHPLSHEEVVIKRKAKE
jgi:hypothetical protein